MRSSCLLLGFCVAAGAACARPTLEEMVVDAGTEPMVSPGSDASTPSTHDATVAAARDADSTETGTPPPRDAGDGDPPDVTVDASTQTPDAGSTPIVAAACKSAAPPTVSTALGAATITDLRIGGTSGSYAIVPPGTNVDVDFSLSVSECGQFGFSGSAVWSGLQDASPKCKSTLCTTASFAMPFATIANTVTAPSEPGLYFIKAAAQTGTFTPCVSKMPDSSTYTNIGAICVSN